MMNMRERLLSRVMAPRRNGGCLCRFYADATTTLPKDSPAEHHREGCVYRATAAFLQVCFEK